MKVSVEVVRGKYVRLRWYYQGKQCVTSTGSTNSPMAFDRPEVIAIS